MIMERKYWIFIDRTIKGPFNANEIKNINGFDENTLVCPENAIGHWKEAKYIKELNLSYRTENIKTDIYKNTEEVELSLIKTLLDKTMEKNAELEREISEKESLYRQKIRELEVKLEEKNREIKFLYSKLTEFKDKINKIDTKPDWEKLYRKLKKNSYEKIAKLEKEILNLKKQNQELLSERELLKHSNKEMNKNYQKLLSLKDELNQLNSKLNYKEAIIMKMETEQKNLVNKLNEFSKLLASNEREKELKIKEFCSEIDSLKAELNRKEQENKQLKSELDRKEKLIKKLTDALNESKNEHSDLIDKLKNKIKTLKIQNSNLK